MKTALILFGIAIAATLLTGCAHDRTLQANSSKSFPRLLNAPGVVVVASSIEVGSVRGEGGEASIEVTRFQAKQMKTPEWAVVLGVGQRVYLRPEEVPSVEDAIASILEVPAKGDGFDYITARYSTPSPNLRVSRIRQPGPVLDRVMQYLGMRYQVNEWYTFDSNDLRRVKELLKEARGRLETLRRGSAEQVEAPNERQ